MPLAGFREVVRSYLDLRWQLDPVAASAAGVVEHDARLGHFSASDTRTAVAALKSMAGALEEVEVDALADAVDQTAVLNDIRVWIQRLEKERPHELNPEHHLTHLLTGLFTLMARDDRPGDLRGLALAARLADAPRFLADARATLKRPAPVFTETALAVARGGHTLLDNAIPAFAAGMPDTVREEIVLALEPAREALREFTDFLAGELTDRSDGDFAIGRDAFDFRLHFEHALPDSAPQIQRYGEALVAELDADLARRADRLVPGTPWRAVAQRMRDDTPEAGELVARYAEAMERARAFVAARGLVSIPAGPLEVVATPGFMAPLIPFAAYEPPGAFAEDRRGFFYVTVPAAGRPADHCVHEIACTALHEGYPGHHLQFLAAQAQASPVRRIIASPLTVEGWALYCEELMQEHGFLATPEESFFQRIHMLWRAVRVVLDVRLHTGGMSVAQAVAYMREMLGIGRESAEAEVRRYCGSPAYQLSYEVGRRELARLRDDRRRRDGPAFDLRRFHDEVLRYGGLPVSLIRWGMGLNER